MSADPYREDQPPANHRAREWTEAQAEAARVNVLATAGCGRVGCEHCPHPGDAAHVKLARKVAVALSDPRLPACPAMHAYGRRAHAVAAVLLADLYAGAADQPAPEGQVPSPAEWLRALLDGDAERRLAMAASAFDNGQAARRCFEANHDGRIAHAEAQARAYLDGYTDAEAHAQEAAEPEAVTITNVCPCAASWAGPAADCRRCGGTGYVRTPEPQEARS